MCFWAFARESQGQIERGSWCIGCESCWHGSRHWCVHFLFRLNAFNLSKISPSPWRRNIRSKGSAVSRNEKLIDKFYSLVICADSAPETHTQNAAMSGASHYLACIVLSDAGCAADCAKMQHYAEYFQLSVLMAYHGCPTGGCVSGGKSAFWVPGGKLVV